MPSTFRLTPRLRRFSLLCEAIGILLLALDAQDFTVRVTLDPPMAKGSNRNIVIQYEGKLTGEEESPVYGIKFAAYSGAALAKASA